MNEIPFSHFETAASGPVRLFTPYKRRRKAQSSDGQQNNDSMNSSTGNVTATVTITSPSVTTHTTHNTANLTLPNNTTIINTSQQPTQHLHIQATPMQNSINAGTILNNNNNNNNTVTINANNGTKKKRYSLNIVNVKSSNESNEDAESDTNAAAGAITFTTSNVSTPAVKEESNVAPWAVTESIQDIQNEYIVDQSREFQFCKIFYDYVINYSPSLNSVIAEFNVPFERMKNIQKQINQLNCDLKRSMDEVREIYTKQVERLQRERDAALLAVSQIDDPNNINAQLPPGVEISNKKVS